MADEGTEFRREQSRMADEDIELRREQFRWQRQRFILLMAMVFAMLVLMVTFGLENIDRIFSPNSYATDRDLARVLERVRSEMVDSFEFQLGISRRLEDLEVRQRNVEQETESLKETITVMSELIEVLRAEARSKEITE